MNRSPVPLAPDLPFPARINPHTSDLAGPLLRWATDLAALPGSAVADWRAARFDVLVGRMYPLADSDLLPVIGRGVLWLFLYDDHLDPGRPGADPVRAEVTTRLATRVVDEPWTPSPPDPLLRALWEVCQQLRERGDAAWWRRCAGDLTDFLDSMRHEVSARAAHRPPALSAYLDARRRTSGWMVLTDLAELCTGQLPAGIHHSNLFERLRASSADVACAVNDLLSLEKEAAAGELHNQVLIRQRLHRCDRPTARRLTLRWARARLGDYTRDRERFRDTSYTDGLESLMRGSLDWSRETARYSG
ncbi:hypothetical protein [Streptomyces sp. NPDC000134]|uniref:terpene synthase family protein n=1 Tax=Streptomyces sp. NPDC000134 TaxID=3364536 RepID=UPI00369556D2